MNKIVEKDKKNARLSVSCYTVLCLFAVISVTSCATITPPHIFIALGDSVSSGYGLPGYADSPEGNHSSVFFEKLEKAGFVDEYHNMAVSGFTTTMLLEMLNDMGRDKLNLFQNARIITLNIGGNNLLVPFLDYVTGLQAVTGAGTIRTGAATALSGTWGTIYEIISGIPETGLGVGTIGTIITRMGDIISGIGGIISGTGEITSGHSALFSLWRGSLSPELEAMLEEGIQTFATEFTEIISWLQVYAPNAVIIVNTIHNPFPQEILRASVPISYWANMLIASMNYIILAESKSRGYLAVDLHYYFLNRLYLTSFNLNPFTGAFSLDLVHPNAQGHELIAALHYAAIAEYLYSE